MATSRVRYVKLMAGFKNLFQDIKEDKARKQFEAAHDKLMDQLQQLEDEFKSDGIDNENRLRPLPSELDIGAGY